MRLRSQWAGKNAEKSAGRAQVEKPLTESQPAPIIQSVAPAASTKSGAADAFNALLGSSAAMQALRSQLSMFADSPFPVLLEGESGSGKELAAVEKTIYDEIAKLQTQPSEDWELQKVRMIARRGEVSGAQSTLNRAIGLADSTVNYGDPNLVNTQNRKLATVTKEDVMRVAKKYLTQDNRSVIITLPKKAAPLAAKP